MIPYMGQAMLLECTAQVHSSNILSVTCPQLKICLICAWTQQWKEACLPRPAGGAVEKIGRCFSYYIVEPRWQGATICGPITEVKQPWARSILGWVTIQDTLLVAKDVIVTCHVPLWPMSYEHTRGSQSAP